MSDGQTPAIPSDHPSNPGGGCFGQKTDLSAVMGGPIKIGPMPPGYHNKWYGGRLRRVFVPDWNAIAAGTAPLVQCPSDGEWTKMCDTQQSPCEVWVQN